MYMPVTDSMFLLGESREHPMHVGGLQLFTPPADEPTFVRDFVETLRAAPVGSKFRRRPSDPVASMGNVWWSEAPDIDPDYHVRHSALPRPGRIRELFQQVSVLHGSLLDRHRPLWEAQVIEGLDDGRFALYTKVHHSLVDGVSAIRHMQRMLSEDPDDRSGRAAWQSGLRAPRPPAPAKFAGIPLDPMGAAKTALGVAGQVGEIAGMLPAAVKVTATAFRDNNYMTPFGAPRTLFNVPIGGARRFVAQSYDVDRVTAVREATGATVNDVILAMCGGALRAYLEELSALPDKSLTTMVPVSLRKPGDTSDSNSVGAIIATLGTDIDDPLQRLDAVRASVRAARRTMSQLSPLQVLATSALNCAGIALAPIPGFVNHTRPPFNVVISNVPGPKSQLYWNGAELSGIYPASIVLDGLALNITIISTARTLEFGITACRRSVPHVQRLIHHLEDALLKLEKAVAGAA